MNYTQLTDKKKAQIDILLQQGLSMRKVAAIMKVHHSTISRYKNNIYKKRKMNVEEKYAVFIKYLFDHYDRRHHSIEVCIHNFKTYTIMGKCYTYTMKVGDKKLTLKDFKSIFDEYNKKYFYI